MKIINKPILYTFSEKHPEISEYLAVWILNAAKVKWKRKEDILKTFPKAELQDGNKVLFPIIHSHYYIQADIHYSAQILSISLIDTRPEHAKTFTVQSSLSKEASHVH